MQSRFILVLIITLAFGLQGCELLSGKNLHKTEEGYWQNQTGDFTDEDGQILSTFDNNQINAERE